MKRIIPLFLVAMFALVSFSCSSDDDNVDQNQNMTDYPDVYDLVNVNFTRNSVDEVFTISRTFNQPLYDSDVVLIYRQTGATSNGSPVWQPLPITMYFEDGHELDYTYDFSSLDFQIYAGGTFELNGTSYVNSQTFRVVLVPATFGKNADNQVDYNDYESVINYYNIDDTNVGTL